MMPKVEFVEHFLRAAVPEIKYEFDQVNRATIGTLSGERRLLMAVLEDAVETFQAGHKDPTMHKDCPHCEAAAWFASKNENWLFSLLPVCEHLGLNPEAVRAAVLGKKKRAA